MVQTPSDSPPTPARGAALAAPQQQPQSSQQQQRQQQRQQQQQQLLQQEQREQRAALARQLGDTTGIFTVEPAAAARVLATTYDILCNGPEGGDALAAWAR
jgi:hypothetical protein